MLEAPALQGLGMPIWYKQLVHKRISVWLDKRPIFSCAEAPIGSVWVPDALRDVVGKREIRRSLQTGGFQETGRLARLERMKLDAEWDALRGKARLEDKQPLRESDVLQMDASWFVERSSNIGAFGQPAGDDDEARRTALPCAI
ncbi:DUF6538 domain-containing protein [Jiella mangrovi]|uniref:DUF6538 domain-containing protein n=1 Tax=Jiella mangrovi TaxID=2821407 RepID=A0ABS4BH62_9HYPH|nr:DUF6538 domain-containing protein [Jiella mangrovi]MBP0616098.1 hypothetical protein [Jiella mangrovi]